MDQAAAPDTRFRPGQSGNPQGAKSRKQRHAELLSEIASDMGGVDMLSAGDRVMLNRAVDLLISRPSNADCRVRLISAAWRIIERIRTRRQPKEPVTPSLQELMGNVR
jgi:hypothetical protein